MAVWIVRGAKGGVHEQRMLDNNFASIGFDSIPNMSSIKSQEEVQNLYSQIHPDAKHKRMITHSAQLWNFIGRMKKGDLVVVPLKTQSAIAIGEVIGEYEYSKKYGDDIRHLRKVKWLQTDMPRNIFDQDLLYSFGAYLTVGRVKAENAEERIKAILKGTRIPVQEEVEGEISAEKAINVEQIARDQIIKHIEENFKGHDFAELIDAILQAQGYVTKRSSPGPDGGVDILAGSGTMGFDSPRLCVQVKSGGFHADVNVLRSLQGVMGNFDATQGLLVCWGGFKRTVMEEARRKFFSIRLWDSDEVLNMIFKYYDKLPETIQAVLPLKRLWSLAIEEEVE